MTIQVRRTDGLIRQFCQICEDEYSHEFNPHGKWMHPRNLTLVEQAERDHDLNHHTPAILKGRTPRTDDRRVVQCNYTVGIPASPPPPGEDILNRAAERVPLVLPEPIANACIKRMEDLVAWHRRDPNLLDYEGLPSYRAEAEGIARAILAMDETAS